MKDEWGGVSKRLLIWLSLVGLIGFLTACASVEPVVKIGLVAPFEGRDRAVGYDVIYSARLAVREINAAGGINGTRVALVALDDNGDPQLAAETAAALAIDPAVVAVLGHWLPDTSAEAAPIYATHQLTFIPMGESPFGATDPALNSAEFTTAYEAVTPFDETPGPYAATTYNAFQQLWTLLETAQTSGEITRISVQNAAAELQ